VLSTTVISLDCAVLFNTGTPVDDLMVALNKPGILFDMCTTDEGEVYCITWTTQRQLSLIAAYPEVIMMDGTYKVSCVFTALFL